MLLQHTVWRQYYIPKYSCFAGPGVWLRPENDQSPSVSNDVQSYISLILTTNVNNLVTQNINF